jgi:hypothetical protein
MCNQDKTLSHHVALIQKSVNHSDRFEIDRRNPEEQKVCTIWRAWVERSLFSLGNFLDQAIQLTRETEDKSVMGDAQCFPFKTGAKQGLTARSNSGKELAREKTW